MGQGGKPAEEEPTVVQPHISDAPIAPEGFRMIQEGHAFVLEKQENEVFYNKAQVRELLHPRARHPLHHLSHSYLLAMLGVLSVCRCCDVCIGTRR